MIYERFVCRESIGRVSRTVRRLPPNAALALDVFDRLQDVPSMFSWHGKPEVGTIEQLLDPRNLFWLVDDVGLLGCIPTEWPGVAHVHCTFWDHRMRGREGMCQAMLVHFQNLGFVDFLTAMPVEATVVRAFAGRLGFSEIGQQDGCIVLHLHGEMLHRATPSWRAA